jgi:hypothetical protein
MRNRHVIFAIAAVMIPTLAAAQKTSYDYDKSANFRARGEGFDEE